MNFVGTQSAHNTIFLEMLQQCVSLSAQFKGIPRTASALWGPLFTYPGRVLIIKMLDTLYPQWTGPLPITPPRIAKGAYVSATVKQTESLPFQVQCLKSATTPPWLAQSSFMITKFV